MSQSQAQLRNAAARRLIARNRLREALDVLNEAIRIDPRWAESYDNRATVFERMGMYPQADADRRKVDELGGVVGPEPLPLDTEAAPAEGRRPPPALRYPVEPRPQGGAAAYKALGTVLIAVGLFVAAGIGIFIALSTLSDAIQSDDDDSVAATATADGSETPGATDGSPTPVESPTPESPSDALRGDPLSFSRVEAAWIEKNLTVEVGDPSNEVSGFKTTAITVTLTRDESTMVVAVLFYDSPDEMQTDWNIGADIVPKAGGVMPAGTFAWANLNAVIVVAQSDEAIRPDAREAFLDLTS